MKKWMNKGKEVGNGIVNEFGNLDHEWNPKIYKLTQFSSYISSNVRFSKSSTHFTQIGTGGSPSLWSWSSNVLFYQTFNFRPSTQNISPKLM
jgi:hypothetical protein